MAKGKTEKKDGYKATDSFQATFPKNTIGLADELYKALADGESVDLKNVPIKIINYLAVNNFIVK